MIWLKHCHLALTNKRSLTDARTHAEAYSVQNHPTLITTLLSSIQYIAYVNILTPTNKT
jgi:hypothetical protein